MDDLRAAVRRLTPAVVSGGVAGLLIGGVGGRAAMLLLRLTSSADGVTSDDGFVIGRVTLAGTAGLLALATAIGVVGALVYCAVAPWLIGPPWLRHVTCGLGAGAVVGSMLVHADGVDFILLEPAWLAIVLFVAIPTLFGLVVGPLHEWCQRPDGWVNRSPWRRRLAPLAVVAVAPFTLPVLAVVTLGLLAGQQVGITRLFGALRSRWAVRLVVRAAWLSVAGAGATALGADTAAIL